MNIFGKHFDKTSTLQVGILILVWCLAVIFVILQCKKPIAARKEGGKAEGYLVPKKNEGEIANIANITVPSYTADIRLKIQQIRSNLAAPELLKDPRYLELFESYFAEVTSENCSLFWASLDIENEKKRKTELILTKFTVDTYLNQANGIESTSDSNARNGRLILELASVLGEENTIRLIHYRAIPREVGIQINDLTTKLYNENCMLTKTQLIILINNSISVMANAHSIREIEKFGREGLYNKIINNPDFANLSPAQLNVVVKLAAAPSR